MKLEGYGYRRKNGKIGIRNHILFLSTVGCANVVARRIGFEYPHLITIENTAGCCALLDDQVHNQNMLLGLARNPNVAAVVFIGLGCEQTDAEYLHNQLEGEKIVAHVTIQEEGGTDKALEKCRALATELVAEVNKFPKERFSVNELVVATKCGGSDWTTAIASNAAVGIVSDRIIQAGGTSLMGETAGWFGGEGSLLKRARNDKVKTQILTLLLNKYEEAEKRGTRIERANPSPGNIAGGITTLAEKAMGTIRKSGESPIEGVLSIGEYPPQPGLWLMDNPIFDVGSLAGMMGAGAHVILFTTGRGTPLGSPLCPVIKICASPKGIQRMGTNIDVDISDIISSGALLNTGAGRIEKVLKEVMEGKLTISESIGCREFIMPQLGVL